MTEPGGGVVHVELVMPDALEEEVQAEVAAGFVELGCTTTVRVLPTRRGWSGVEWMVLATVALDTFLHALATKAAEDVHTCLRGLLLRLVHARSGRRSEARLLVLRDPRTHLQIVLEDDLPLAAYQQLVGLDLSAFSRGPLHYDRSRAKWRSELDEQRRQSRPEAGRGR